MPMTAFRRVGWKTIMPINPVGNKTMTAKTMIMANLLLTRFMGEIGEAKIRHIVCPSSPIRTCPSNIAIPLAGTKKITPDQSVMFDDPPPPANPDE